MHILEDYSLSEISELLSISRQGVHDSLRRARTALLEYEDALHLVERFMQTRERMQRIRLLAEQVRTADPEKRAVLLDQITACTLENE